MRKEERIELIKKIINNLDSDRIEDITENAFRELSLSEVYDEEHDAYDYTISNKEAVEYAYIHEFTFYFEEEEDGMSFVDTYYNGEYTSELYKEIEEACQQYVSTLSDNDIEVIFEIDEPMKPSDVEWWIHH